MNEEIIYRQLSKAFELLRHIDVEVVQSISYWYDCVKIIPFGEVFLDYLIFLRIP